MEKVQLKNNKAFSWVQRDGLFVKGYLFDRSGTHFEGAELLTYFNGTESYLDLKERVKYANGCFAIVINRNSSILAATDMIRSFPLFYGLAGKEWVVTDHAETLIDLSGCILNETASKEFLATGYVTGRETLLEGIFQLEAGQVIKLSPEDIVKEFYYTYRVNDESEEEYQDLRAAGVRIIEESFQRLIESLNNRTAVIPLSGGFDSRLIATMLRKMNYPHVICFTYGRESSPEIPVSREVAAKLGFEWHFLEYTDELIRDYIHDEDFRGYYSYASNLVSMFFMQEYFAVKELKQKNLIPEDSVFLPGHSGDFLGGSQLNKHGNLSMEESLADLADRIYRVKYCYKKPGGKDTSLILERIKKSLQEKFLRQGDFAYSIHEDWDFKEKLAKFNFNSVSTYTWFGYQYRLPYWDKNLVEFFRYLPLHAKIHKYLYDDILTNEFFSKYDLNLTDELQADERDLRKLKIKSRIKKNLPEAINRTFISKKDLLFYKEITDYLVKDLKAEGVKARIYGNAYNSLIIQWYLHQVVKKCR